MHLPVHSPRTSNSQASVRFSPRSVCAKLNVFPPCKHHRADTAHRQQIPCTYRSRPGLATVHTTITLKDDSHCSLTCNSRLVPRISTTVSLFIARRVASLGISVHRTHACCATEHIVRTLSLCAIEAYTLRTQPRTLFCLESPFRPLATECTIPPLRLVHPLYQYNHITCPRTRSSSRDAQ